jgi:hypothetical protein
MLEGGECVSRGGNVERVCSVEMLKGRDKKIN